MGTTSQYVLDRRENQELMDDKDIERLVRAEEKRERRRLRHLSKEDTA